MKHEREWYTCDRCGEEINEDIYAWTLFPEHFVKRIKPLETISVISNEPYGYACNQSHKPPDIKAVSVVRGYHRKETVMHLCGKCRKEFERFMRNEKIG